MRVVVHLDQGLFAEALVEALRQDGHEAIAVRSGNELLEHAPGADAVVVEVSTNPDDLADTTDPIRAVAADARLVVLGRHLTIDHLRYGRSSGVDAFASMADDLRHLRATIEGQVDTTPRLSRPHAAPRTAPVQRSLAARSLTDREREVLEALARGESTIGLARSLGITYTTARTHIQNVLTKLGVHSRIEAVAVAVAQGIVSPTSSTKARSV